MILTVFHFVLVTWVAQATATGETSLPLAPIDEAGFVLVLADHDGRFSSKPPSGWISNDARRQRFDLADDGQGPDKTAGDAVYTVLVKDTPRGQVELALLSNEIEVWKDSVPIGQTMRNPIAELNFRNGKVQVNFSTFDRSESAEAAPAAPSSIPNSSVVPEGTVSVGKMQSTGMLLALLVGLIGLGIGIALGIVLGRKQRPMARLTPTSASPEPQLPKGLPPVRGSAQVWTVDSQSALIPATEWLLCLLSGTGPVLLIPGKGARGAMGRVLEGVVGVSWMTVDHPSPDEVLDACEVLEPMGRPVIVVQGMLALENPADDEESDAVLCDLLDQAEKYADVVAIVVTGETSHAQVTANLDPFLSQGQTQTK